VTPALLLALVPVVVTTALAGGVVAWRRHRRRPGPSLRGLDFVAIDLETTGLDARRDVPVAVAAIPFIAGTPRADAVYATLVNPGRPIPPDAQRIHGITDADVNGAPDIATVLPPFLEACRQRPIVAHTAGFDLAIINRAAQAAGLAPLDGSVLDIGTLAHGLFPSWWDLSLEGLARLSEVEPLGRHTAEGDALTAGLIFLRMIPMLEQQGVLTLADALRLQRRGPLVPGGPGATGGGLTGP
jgi:DNA polymerase III epsilon subunit-like protein